MISSQSNVQKQTQRQKQVPQMIYVTQLLSLPYYEIIPFLQEMTMSNPMLEQTDLCSLDYHDETPYESGVSSGDSSYDFLQYTGDRPFEDSLDVALRLQIAALPLAERDRRTALGLLSFVGNNGYLEMPELEGGTIPGYKPEEYEALLLYLQNSLEPKGLLARNLGECLALQIPDSAAKAACFRTILKNDIDAFSGRKTTYLTKKYRLSRPELQELYDLVSRMNPCPGDAYSAEDKSVYVRPDASVLWSEEDGSLKISLSDISRFISMNREYEEMMNDHGLDAVSKAYLKQNHEQASLLLNSLRMCDRLYYRFLEKLSSAQFDFFRYGKQSLKPMTAKAFAEELGVSASTVSRLVNSRYVRTDFGVFSLKYFFSTGIASDSGDLSSRTIKEELRKIIDSEAPDHPYTDDDLSNYLSDLGIPISRRTVSKYRDLMGIPSCKKRRRFV